MVGRNYLVIFLSLVLLLSCRSGSRPDYPAYKKEVFTENGVSLPYRILYPENFDKKKRYPVLFFLHHSGSMGNDNNSQLRIGADKFLTKTGKPKFPAIIIFPQCS